MGSLKRASRTASRSWCRAHSGVELDDAGQAVATFAIRASEKLRARSLRAGGVWVSLNTTPFKSGAKQYPPSPAVQLITPCADTREVLAMGHAMVRSIYRMGYAYKKAGVGLLDLSHGDTQQADLFAAVDPRSAKLMAVLDQLGALVTFLPHAMGRVVDGGAAGGLLHLQCL